MTDAGGRFINILDGVHNINNIHRNEIEAFNRYFLEAVKQLYATTHDYVYKIFLGYNGINPARVVRNKEYKLSYRATQFIQNSEFVKMKIYMFFLE